MMSEEEVARTVAHIMGQQSGAAQAIAELDRRRKDGEEVGIFQWEGRWVVGRTLGWPNPPEEKR
jgi:hypothetical protein